MEDKKNMVNSQDSLPLLKISPLVEDKIRYMCSKYPTLEWSGVLFYKVSGSFERKNLTLTTVDLLVLDLGSSTFTEYPNHPEIAYFMAENGYEKFSRGLIHSHNMMSSFFSGTDTRTLEKEGLDNIHFLSLIVNNAGEYTAKITKQVKHNILNVPEYSTFGGKVIKGKPTSSVKITVEPVDVKIEYQPKVDKFPDIMDACNRIKKEEEEERKKVMEENKRYIPVVLGGEDWHQSRGLQGYMSLIDGRWCENGNGKYSRTPREEWGCKDYKGDSKVTVSPTSKAKTPPKVSYEKELNLKKVLSLNMGLLPNEARSITYYVNSLGRFKDVFKRDGEFSEVDLRSFIETFVEALVWDEDGEKYTWNVGEILESICLIENPNSNVDDMLNIFLEAVDSVYNFARGFSEKETIEEESENNIKEEGNDNK